MKLLPHIRHLRLSCLRQLRYRGFNKKESYQDWLDSVGQWDSGELCWVNVLSGRNGAGKTTITDTIRGLVDPRILCTLQRESLIDTMTSSFRVTTAEGTLRGDFVSADRDVHRRQKLIVQKSGALPREFWLPKFSEDTWEDKEGLEAYLQSGFPYEISHCLASNPLPPARYSAMILESLAHLLPEIGHDDERDPGKRIVFRGEGDKIFANFRGDSQENEISINHLPSGWASFIRTIWILEECKEDSILIIEEPETYLHPDLQRLLIDIIVSQSKMKRVQIFIETHSPTFINYSSDEPGMFKVFFVNSGGQVDQNIRYILDDIGARPSDIAQAGGIIWVEGESDRIYIKHWLKLFCASQNISCPIEHMDYCFIKYGGSLIHHLGLDPDDDRSNVLSVCRNLFIVADGDEAQSGVPSPLKRELIQEALKLEDKRGAACVWKTKQYTIEDYLPSEFSKGTLDKIDGRTKVTARKVDLARRFTNWCGSWSQAMTAEHSDELKIEIERILKSITLWSQRADHCYKYISLIGRNSLLPQEKHWYFSHEGEFAKKVVVRDEETGFAVAQREKQKSKPADGNDDGYRSVVIDFFRKFLRH